MCVGLGAVATTFIAGVSRSGKASPADRFCHQMGTIRLGKRTEGLALVKDFVPLASLTILSSAAGTSSRTTATNLETRGRAPARPARADSPELEAITPWKACSTGSTSSVSTART